MIDPLLIAVPVSVAVGFLVAQMQAKQRLRKFMMTHITMHTRAMTGLAATAYYVAHEKLPDLKKDEFTIQLIREGHRFGLALGGVREDGTHITKDTPVSG
jgi:anaerobic C4-dicarboxylate transporter